MFANGLDARNRSWIPRSGAAGRQQPCAWAPWRRGAPTRPAYDLLAREDALNPVLGTLPNLPKLDARTARPGIELKRLCASPRVRSPRVTRQRQDLCRSWRNRCSWRLCGPTPRRGPSGWMRDGLRAEGPHIGRAPAVMYQRYGAAWAATGLARETGSSRSTVVDQLTTLGGGSLIRCRTAWRMCAVRVRLRKTSQTTAQLAHSVGYEAEGGCHRAFKCALGAPSVQWQDKFRQDRPGGQPPCATNT